MNLVFDSYAWIEFFIGSSEGEKVKQLLIYSKEPMTPSIVLAEIANKYFREGASKEDVRNRIRAIKELTKIIYLDVRIILLINKARRILIENTEKLGIKKKPGLADFIILASALANNAKIVTGDEHFRNLDNVIFIKE